MGEYGCHLGCTLCVTRVTFCEWRGVCAYVRTALANTESSFTLLRVHFTAHSSVVVVLFRPDCFFYWDHQNQAQAWLSQQKKTDLTIHTDTDTCSDRHTHVGYMHTRQHAHTYSGAKKYLVSHPLKIMREACNFHHRYTSTMTDKMRKKIQKITL